MRWMILGVAAIAIAACTDDQSQHDEGEAGAGPDAGAPMTPADAAALPDAPIPIDDPPELPLACELDEVTPVATCAYDNCSDSFGDSTALTLCLTLNCASEFLSLSPECTQCVLAGLTGDLATAQEKCIDGGGFPSP